MIITLYHNTATTLRSDLEAPWFAIMSGAIVGGATGGLIGRAAGADPVGTSVVGAIGAVVGGTIGAWITSGINIVRYIQYLRYCPFDTDILILLQLQISGLLSDW